MLERLSESRSLLRINRPNLPPPVQPRRPLLAILIDVLIFSLGIQCNLLVHIIGDLYVGEIVIIVVLPVLLAFRLRYLLRRELLHIFVLMGLWLFAQTISDVYNHTEISNRLRGTATIIFFTMEIVFFVICLSRNDRRKTIFLAAFLIGSMVITRLRPTRLAEEHPWKFGYAAGTVGLVVLISCYFYARRKYMMVILLLFGMAAVNAVLNFRSAVLELLLTAALVLPVIPERIGRLRLLPPKTSMFRVAVVAILAFVGAWSADQVVHLVTRSELIGEEARQKNETQVQAGNLILGGRPEVFVGLRAALDKPLVGHGSWPRDMKYIELMNDIEAENGMKLDLEDIEAESQGLIPSHSHLIGAWVQAGLLGAVFWAYILSLTVRGIVRVSILRPPLAPVLCLFMVGFFWDNLFSPFGSYERLYAAITIVFILDLLDARLPAQEALYRSSGQWRRRGLRRVAAQ